MSGNRPITNKSKESWRRRSFTQYARRAGYATLADCAGYAIYADHEDFTKSEEYVCRVLKPHRSLKCAAFCNGV